MPNDRPSGSASLDTLETSNRPPIHFSYADRLRDRNPDEYYATIDALIALHGSSTDPHVTRVANCRTRAWFAGNIHTGDIRVFANSCKSRWCLHCARARAARIAHATRKWTAEIVRPKLLTLTLKHSSAPLDHQLDSLYRFFRRLRQARKFKSLVHGGIWFCQIKKSADDQWHPHLHCVLDAEYVPHATIKTLWSRITHGSEIVDIRTVRSPEKAANYVARYVARPAMLGEYETDDQLEILNAFESRRLVGTWGTAKDADLTGKADFVREDWRYIGTWDDVTVNGYGDDWRATILQHWQENTPVNPDWLKLITDREDKHNDDPTTEPDPPPRQLMLLDVSERMCHR